MKWWRIWTSSNLVCENTILGQFSLLHRNLFTILGHLMVGQVSIIPILVRYSDLSLFHLFSTTTSKILPRAPGSPSHIWRKSWTKCARTTWRTLTETCGNWNPNIGITRPNRRMKPSLMMTHLLMMMTRP